jgi:hypothetical protein
MSIVSVSGDFRRNCTISEPNMGNFFPQGWDERESPPREV